MIMKTDRAALAIDARSALSDLEPKGSNTIELFIIICIFDLELDMIVGARKTVYG